MDDDTRQGFSIETHNRSRSARAAILGRLESAFEGQPPVLRGEGYLRRTDGPVPESDQERMLDRFRDHQVGYHLVSGAEELVDLVANQLYPRKVRGVIVDERDLVARVGMVEGLRRRLLEVEVMPVVPAERPPESAELGITPCQAIIAETGSIVLAADRMEALQASLLPGMHYVVAEEAQVVPDMAAWLASDRFDPGRHHVLVSGPSRTADIEKKLVIGVHGPWKVSVFVLRAGWESR